MMSGGLLSAFLSEVFSSEQFVRMNRTIIIKNLSFIFGSVRRLAGNVPGMVAVFNCGLRELIIKIIFFVLMSS